MGEVAEVSDELIDLSLSIRDFPLGSSAILISNGRIINRSEVKNKYFRFKNKYRIMTDSYFRVEIRNAENNVLALTNPIYLKIKK